MMLHKKENKSRIVFSTVVSVGREGVPTEDTDSLINREGKEKGIVSFTKKITWFHCPDQEG